MTAAPTILLVDDDEDPRFILRTLLELESLRVLEAADAKSALEILRETRCDLVMTDQRLSGANGTDLIRWVREGRTEADGGATPRDVVVVLTSGDSIPQLLGKDLHLADAFLPKPLTFPEVLGPIHRLFPGGGASAGILRDCRAVRADYLAWVGGKTDPRGALGCVFVDIDKLRNANDRVGRQCIDEDVLPEVERIIDRTVRDRGHAYTQPGGGHFVLLLPNHTADATRAVGRRLRADIAAHRFGAGGVELALTASIGVASCPSHGDDISFVLAAARAARLTAKERGGNKVVVASPPAATQ